MKKMAQKNLFYSVLLAAVMLTFLVGYFTLMLPSLYVAYMKEQDLESIKLQHRAFVETGTYDGVQVKNPTACASWKIPFKGDSIDLTTKLISLRITAHDNSIKELLKELQNSVQNYENMDSFREYQTIFQDKMSDWQRELTKIYQTKVQLPVSVDILSKQDTDNLYYGESITMHTDNGRSVIMEFNISDDQNQYTNYLAMEQVKDGIAFTVLPVVTPQMGEIKPIVLQSLPMLGAVILALVFIFSKIYSNGIVSPALSTIEDLYMQVQSNYEKLKAANQALLEENERQEMFLRSCSHQLKTPITAALLLTDGMIQQVGKYKDTKTYLPKVKQQLLWMQKMTAEILSLNQEGGNARCCLYEFIQSLLAPYRIKAEEKNLQILLEKDMDVYIETDLQLLSKILDNLLSNAVHYSPVSSCIQIVFHSQRIFIRNEHASIPDELLPHIFEPFVSGGQKNSSHGLGLYIAAYCAKRIGATLTIQNKNGGVEAELSLSNMI